MVGRFFAPRLDDEARALREKWASRSRRSRGAVLQSRPQPRFLFQSVPSASTGREVPVAVIDGPYDPGALSGILSEKPVSLASASCSLDPNSACIHGTFITGLLGARRNAPIPGLCPDSKILHFPLFVDSRSPQSSVAELANAISLAVVAGARLINLSLAILGDDAQHDPALAAALDRAETSGAVLVVAAGNQGRLAMGQLLSHPVTIPVVAVDAAGRLLPECNFGPSISRRGVAAIGHNVVGYAPGGGTTAMSGTSVATAVASGTLAALWSRLPLVKGADIRTAVACLGPRIGSTPPLLDAGAICAALDQQSAATQPISSLASRNIESYASLQGEPTMSTGTLPRIALNAAVEASGASGNAVAPAHGSSGCNCGAPGEICKCADSPRPIYVLGSVDIVIPHQAVSEELQTLALALSHDYPTEHLQEPRPNEELRLWQCRVLSKKEARYLARQMHWILKVEGFPAYYLSLRDLQDLDDLIKCLDRSDNEDLDLFVGSSSLIDVGIHPGINLPVLSVDQIDIFSKEKLIEWFKTKANAPPKQLAKRAPPGADQNRTYEQNLHRLFKRLGQNADNRGDTDELRALNYLAVRYRPLYALYADIMMGRQGWSFDGVRVIRSRLSRGEKRVVDPVFTFRHKPTGDIEQYFMRVDVSHLFPVVVHHIDEYFER